MQNAHGVAVMKWAILWAPRLRKGVCADVAWVRADTWAVGEKSATSGSRVAQGTGVIEASREVSRGEGFFYSCLCLFCGDFRRVQMFPSLVPTLFIYPPPLLIFRNFAHTLLPPSPSLLEHLLHNPFTLQAQFPALFHAYPPFGSSISSLFNRYLACPSRFLIRILPTLHFSQP